MPHLKTNSKEFKTKMESYILNCIDTTPYGGTGNETDEEKIAFTFDTFKKEYWFPGNQKRYGTPENGFREWLMGLPSVIAIDFENYHIIEIAREMGSYKDTTGMSEKAIERYDDSIIANWFPLLSRTFFDLLKKHGIKY